MLSEVTLPPSPTQCPSDQGRGRALAHDVLGRIAERMAILSRAVGRPLPPSAPAVPRGPLDGLVRLIGMRCQQDAGLRADVAKVLDQYVEARHLAFGQPDDVPGEALEASVTPLMTLHETLGRDPFLRRLFGPETRSPQPGRPGTGGIPGGTDRPPGGSDGRSRDGGLLLGGTGRLLGGTGRLPGGIGAVPGGTGRLPGGTGLLHLPGPRLAPARLATAVEVDVALLRASRCLAFAESAIEGLRKRIAMLEAALELASTGKSTAVTLAPPPVARLVRQLAAVAADPAVAGRISDAVRQFHDAERAFEAATGALNSARKLPPREARAAVKAMGPERIGRLVDPLTDLSAVFRGHPVLTRLFPAAAV